jgi:hypothetical protein
MRSQRIFLIGYLVFMGAVIAALVKSGIIDRIGTVWTGIIVAAMVGVGIMLAVSRGGREIKIDR